MPQVSATVSGYAQPHFALPPSGPWFNGDFRVTGEQPVRVASDPAGELRYHNEVTEWTFDFTRDAGWAAFCAVTTHLLHASLTITLRPSFGGQTTNGVQIFQMRYFGHPQDPVVNPDNYIQTDDFYNLAYQAPGAPGLVVTIELLPTSRYPAVPKTATSPGKKASDPDGYKSADILKALQGFGTATKPEGRLHMVYADDSLVTDATLVLLRA